jgi:hypothetical protein
MNFGNTSVGTYKDGFLANLKRVNRYYFAQTGTVTKLSVYLAPTSTKGRQTVEGVVYADSGGTPGALLGRSGALTFSSTNGAGWYSLPLTSAPSLDTGYYWIGVLTGDTSGVAGFRYNSGSGARKLNSNTFTSGPSSQFGSANTDNEQMSVYATYTSVTTPPSNTAAPTISETPAAGSTLTGTAGSWSGSPTGYAYAWQRCGTTCAPISGATGATYTVQTADAGSTLKVSVTASNSAGSTTATSAPTAQVAAPSNSSTTDPAKPACTQMLSPGASLGPAVMNAPAGAVICLEPGDYTGATFYKSNGTESGPITLTSVDSSNPAVIQGRTVTEDTANYITLTNLRFVWTAGNIADTVSLASQHIVFSHNDVSGAGQTICLNLVNYNGYEFDYGLVDHNLIHNCENDNIHNQGIYIYGANNNTITNNWCWAVSARCYQIRGGNNNVWHNNTSDDDNWGWIFGDYAPTNNNVYNNISGPDVRSYGAGTYSAGGSVDENETTGGSGNSFHDNCMATSPYLQTSMVSYTSNTYTKVQFADPAHHDFSLSSASANDPCRSYEVQGGNPGPVGAPLP